MQKTVPFASNWHEAFELLRDENTKKLIQISRGALPVEELNQVENISDAQFAFNIDQAIRYKVPAAVKALIDSLAKTPPEGQDVGKRLAAINMTHGNVHPIRINQFFAENNINLRLSEI